MGTQAGVSGTARWGDTLTGTDGSFTPALFTTVNQVQRQWFQCTSTTTASCTAISGATNNTYVARGVDLGKRLRYATRANSKDTATGLVISPYTAYNFSPATAPVAQNPPDLLSPPTFSGTPRFGETLTRTSFGSWNNPTPTSYASQWVRCDLNVENCISIPGGTNSTYKLGQDDVGRRIRLHVFAAGPFGLGLADSAPSTIVVPDSEPGDNDTPPSTDEPGDTAPTKLKPFPKIIVAGVLRGPGVVISDFVVRGQRNVKVKIRCRGFSCPYARRTIIKRKRRIHIRSLERAFFSGVKIEIRIVKKGRIGKYTRIRIRAGKAPKRVDRCVFPGVKQPRRCP